VFIDVLTKGIGRHNIADTGTTAIAVELGLHQIASAFMQAIETRWLGPTDTKGSRIVARCDARRLVVSWDHGQSQEQNHRDAARKLIRELGWFGAWSIGTVPSLPNSYVHTNIRREDASGCGNYESWHCYQGEASR
jgi:hypothetical protein